jgi:hypothetical protein
MEKVWTKLALDGGGAVNMEPRLERVKYFETVLEQISKGADGSHEIRQDLSTKEAKNPVISTAESNFSRTRFAEAHRNVPSRQQTVNQMEEIQGRTDEPRNQAQNSSLCNKMLGKPVGAGW